MDKQRMAESLRILRGEKSRKEVADAVEISVSALCMYENARREPRDEVKERLMAYYRAGEELFF